ncbi:MAG: DUF1858 domain-containing protein, partial [Lachnospiraceae bacterium]|nr:DUF1858 domain-containing protein [Lachnospiraceae bacterium]
LMECGMGCVTCPASQMETLEEAAMVHYLEPDEVRNYLNERISYTIALEENGLKA